MPDSITSLVPHLIGAWHPGYLGSLAVACALILILSRARSEFRLLRSAIIATILCIILILSRGIASWLGHSNVANTLDAITVLTLGLLLIRLSALSFFRVGLPVFHINPPRILEDILLVVAYLIWGMVCLSRTNIDIGGLVATSAVITAIVAFSMQDTLGNILGGLALQLDDSIHIGDWIKVDDVNGRVIEVHWRHTALRTRNGEIVVLPNSMLMKSKFTIISRDDTPQWRRWVYFSLSLDIPPQRVIAAIEKALSNASIPLVSQSPRPNCVLMEFRDGVGSYAVRYWLTDVLVDDPTDSAVRVHIYAALQREGWRLVPPSQDIQLHTQSPELQDRKYELELALRHKTLRKIDMFSQLSDEEINQLARSLTYAPFAKGDVMTKQGSIAHWLYILIEGEADVWLESPNQPPRFLSTLTAGRVFGEMGLMTGEPRRTTVTARTDSACYRIDKKNFESIIRSRPELAEVLATTIAERNNQLEALQQQNSQKATNNEQHKQRLLDSIRQFFRL